MIHFRFNRFVAACVVAIAAGGALGCASDLDEDVEPGVAADAPADSGDEATDESESALGSKRAPACVTSTLRYTTSYSEYTVRNGCKTTQRVKLDLAATLDTKCRSLAPGRSFKERLVNPSGFRKVARC